MRRGHTYLLLSGILLGGVLLGGCGDSASDGASTSPDAAPRAQEPACDEIWVDGEDLPKKYAGCSQGGTWVKAEVRRCESGQILVTFDDRYYGAKGFRVNDMGESLSESGQYQRALRSCG
jgi:hypothetical protein